MAVIVEKSGKDFEIPDEGLYQAVLADVIDLGEVDTQFGKKHKVRLIYLLAETDSEGQQFRLMQQMTASIHEKATLYKTVRRLLGKNPESPFDLEVLLGKQCQLDVQQNESEGKMYANIMGVLSPVKGQNVTVPKDFVRFVNKEKQEKAQAKAAVQTKTATAKKATGVKVTPQAAEESEQGTVNL